MPKLQKIRIQPWLLAERLPKAMQSPPNTLLDIALPYRETRSSSIHQDSDTSPPDQETFTRYWSNPTHGRQNPQLRGRLWCWEGLGAGGEGKTEDEMAGWHHWLDGRESQWTPGVGDGQGGLACCNSWGRKESDTTERLLWSDLMTFQEKGDQEHSKLNNMKRQRNIQQIRDHGKNPQDQINEDEISSIAEKIQSDDSKDDPK